MPASTVIVRYSDGSPASSVRVVLGFDAGMTRPAFTNSRGEAVVEHASVGRATVYVSDRDCVSFHAPGRIAVTSH